VRIRYEFLQRGAVVASTPWRAYTAEVRRIGALVPPIADGRYAVRLAATNGIDTITTKRWPISVVGSSTVPETSPPPASPKAFRPELDAADGPIRWWILSGFLGAAVVSGLGLAWRRRRRRIRTP
jgi:hypothetical protein